MNGTPATQPLQRAANRLLDDMETAARKDPAKAALVALGVGMALNLVPSRALVASATAVTITMLRPALLVLGLVKALELCRTPKPRLP
jgi:hypothetical protein